MPQSTFWDKNSGAVFLALLTFAIGVYGIVHAFSGFASTAACPSSTAQSLPDSCNAAAPIVLLMGSIVPFMIGLFLSVVTIDAAIYKDGDGYKLVGITWTGINNMLAGLLSGYGLLYLGLSSAFAGSASSICAGGVIAGIGAAAMFASLIKWP
jgi:hypothetical protein